MSGIPDSEKFGPDGKIHVIDDHIPTPEELEESIAKLDPEYVERIRKEIREFDRKNQSEE